MADHARREWGSHQSCDTKNKMSRIVQIEIVKTVSMAFYCERWLVIVPCLFGGPFSTLCIYLALYQFHFSSFTILQGKNKTPRISRLACSNVWWERQFKTKYVQYESSVYYPSNNHHVLTRCSYSVMQYVTWTIYSILGLWHLTKLRRIKQMYNAYNYSI